MLKKILKIEFTDRAVPVILLLAVFISFGLLIPWLGFFWDDWPVIYLTHTQGIKGFWDFYQYDRPFSAWTYILLAPVLGTNSIAWQIFVLLLRWLTAVMIWLVLRLIWPGKEQQAFWVSLLFVVCPLFPQQPVAVAYSQHWIAYLFYFLSLYWMLKALESPGRVFLYISLAVIFALIHLATMEYFLGLEFLRPVVLWLYFQTRSPQSSYKKLLRVVAKSVWIYIPVWLLYVIWRLYFLKLPTSDVNNPVLVTDFLKNPLLAAWNLLERTVQDVFYLLTSWIVTINPLDIEFDRPFSLAVLLLVLVVFVIFSLVLKRFRSAEENVSNGGWGNKAMAFGLLAIVLGVLPVWVIGRQVTLGGDRFSLAAMFGVCLFAVGFLSWLSDRRQPQIIAVSILLALAVHTNLYTAKSFQISWERQRAFYWQLYWRAPYVTPNTPFISDGEIFPFVGRYSTSMGIALLYPPAGNPRQVPYWFFVYWENIFRLEDKLFTGTRLPEGLRNYTFSGQSRESLVFRFAADQGQCLEILSPPDVNVKEITEPLKSLAAISNLQRISDSPLVPNWKPPRQIFGTEPEHQWCYYFEKAELAAQVQDWQQVVSFLEEARSKGYTAADEEEYLVFIDAYIQLGDYQQAYDLTMDIKGGSKKNNDILCALWKRNGASNSSVDFQTSFEEVNQRLSCG